MSGPLYRAERSRFGSIAVVIESGRRTEGLAREYAATLVKDGERIIAARRDDHNRNIWHVSLGSAIRPVEADAFDKVRRLMKRLGITYEGQLLPVNPLMVMIAADGTPRCPTCGGSDIAEVDMSLRVNETEWEYDDGELLASPDDGQRDFDTIAWQCNPDWDYGKDRPAGCGQVVQIPDDVEVCWS